MDQQQNTMASVSLGSAIGLVVLFCVSFCLGFIPIVSLLNLLIFPLQILLAVTGLVTGIMGLSQARALDGEGHAKALVGVIVPVLWGLLQALMIAMGVGLVMMMVLLDSL